MNVLCSIASDSLSFPVYRDQFLFLNSNILLMKGIIFNVKRYAIHDGPGIRVAFFMKGCPLSCWWCHNPEGISPEPEEVIQTNKVGGKEFSRKSIVGKPYKVEDILSVLDRERVFLEKSGGGVTFSGGEPLMQHQFLLEALKACKEAGYHTAVDTSGHCPAARLRKIIPYTDLFLYDIKHPDALKHEFYTGVSNKLILNNLRLLLSNRKDVMIRIPVVPGINDNEEYISGFMRIIKENKSENIKMINLLPYHRIGSSKYRKFNRTYRMEEYKQPSESRMKELSELFGLTGIRVKIGG
jgi:pyruvate formate lyase activating enzyme